MTDSVAYFDIGNGCASVVEIQDRRFSLYDGHWLSTKNHVTPENNEIL